MIASCLSGLSPTIVRPAARVVAIIHRLGATIVLVEPSLPRRPQPGERAVFMENGELLFTVPTRRPASSGPESSAPSFISCRQSGVGSDAY